MNVPFLCFVCGFSDTHNYFGWWIALEQVIMPMDIQQALGETVQEMGENGGVG
jgi:hypothetical protein